MLPSQDGAEHLGATAIVSVRARAQAPKYFLRDFRTGDRVEMNPAVFDILYEIQAASGSSGTFQVISAYRSPATNEMLRGKSSGVAKNSQHLSGNAIDSFSPLF